MFGDDEARRVVIPMDRDGEPRPGAQPVPRRRLDVHHPRPHAGDEVGQTFERRPRRHREMAKLGQHRDVSRFRSRWLEPTAARDGGGGDFLPASGSRTMRSDLTALVSRLVAIDSVNPSLVAGGAGEAEIAAFIADWARDARLEADVLEETPGRPSVVVRAPGTGGGRTLLLCGH